MSVDIEDDRVGTIIDRCILEYSGSERLSLKDKLEFKRELFNSLRRLDVLSDMLADEEITEIMINGHGNLFAEKKGRLVKLEQTFESEERLTSVIQNIVAGCNRIVNEASPIVDARLADGSRVNVVLPPIALNGPTMTIRKFPKEAMTMKKLIEYGAVSEEVADFLKKLVIAGYNIFISGGTGAGKTTFLNALSGYVPKDQRIITIEDSAELMIEGVDNLVRLEARNANVEGENAITIRDLIKSSLRMRPDRIIVGEVRDAAAIDMLAAMNTGHDGSLSTGHANSSRDMLSRLETMVLMGSSMPIEAIRQQIAAAVDIIIHLGRLRDKSRKVIEISEVEGMNNGDIQLNKLYEYVETDMDNGRIVGNLRKINDLHNIRKLQFAGLIDIVKEV
ncbi:MAG: CpaF family protein [Coprococcus sp.]